MSSPVFTPEDRGFLRNILDHPEDHLPWLAYADWLDERNDPRAEYLRLSVELAALSEWDDGREGVAARLAALKGELDPVWMMMFDRPRVGGCDDRWEFRCPLTWDQLAPTDTPDIRRCLSCRRPVFYCHSLTEAEQFASAGQCVALSSRVWPEAEPFGGPPQPEIEVVGMMMAPDTDLDLPPDFPPVEEPPTARRPWWKFW